MRPMAVAMPVATTMPRARPEVTAVPLKAMLSWSAGAPRGDVREGRRDLGDGLRFACQGRLVDTHGRRLQEAQVGRDDVALFEEQDVAGHDLASRHEPHLAVAHDTSLRAGHPLEGVHGLLGAVLLDEADDAVEDDDGQDDQGVLGLADEGRDDGGHQEHDDHGARELVEQQPPGGSLLLLDEFVGPEALETLGRDVGRKPGLGPRLQGGGDRGCLQPPGLQLRRRGHGPGGGTWLAMGSLGCAEPTQDLTAPWDGTGRARSVAPGIVCHSPAGCSRTRRARDQAAAKTCSLRVRTEIVCPCSSESRSASSRGTCTQTRSPSSRVSSTRTSKPR